MVVNEIDPKVEEDLDKEIPKSEPIKPFTLESILSFYYYNLTFPTYAYNYIQFFSINFI